MLTTPYGLCHAMVGYHPVVFDQFANGRHMKLPLVSVAILALIFWWRLLPFSGNLSVLQFGIRITVRAPSTAQVERHKLVCLCASNF